MWRVTLAGPRGALILAWFAQRADVAWLCVCDGFADAATDAQVSPVMGFHRAGENVPRVCGIEPGRRITAMSRAARGVETAPKAPTPH